MFELCDTRYSIAYDTRFSNSISLINVLRLWRKKYGDNKSRHAYSSADSQQLDKSQWNTPGALQISHNVLTPVRRKPVLSHNDNPPLLWTAREHKMAIARGRKLVCRWSATTNRWRKKRHSAAAFAIAIKIVRSRDAYQLGCWIDNWSLLVEKRSDLSQVFHRFPWHLKRNWNPHVHCSYHKFSKEMKTSTGHFWTEAIIL